MRLQIALLSLPWSIGWMALSFLARCLFVYPAMVTDSPPSFPSSSSPPPSPVQIWHVFVFLLHFLSSLSNTRPLSAVRSGVIWKKTNRTAVFSRETTPYFCLAHDKMENSILRLFRLLQTIIPASGLPRRRAMEGLRWKILVLKFTMSRWTFCDFSDGTWRNHELWHPDLNTRG